MPTDERDVVLFVNLTKQCNVNCPRCYLTDEHRKQKGLLPQDIFVKLISHPFFSDARSCTVIWEGGEPTLVGRKAIEDFLVLTRDLLPRARQTMVTNFLNLPDWLVELTKEFFDGRIETTYALGNKFTLGGSHEKYQERFKKSLRKAVDCNLESVVNIELNKETFLQGTDALISVMEETGNKYWEFDVSVDFAQYLSMPRLNKLGYPVLPGTISHDQFSSFIIELFTKHKDRLDRLGVNSSIIEHAKNRFDKNLAFNVKRESEFITINPDGTVTTNPLFSDMPHTYMGNLNNNSTDEILSSQKILDRARHENRRVLPCMSCEYYQYCEGGASHVPLFDGSGECAGSKRIWSLFDSDEQQWALNFKDVK